MKSAKAIVHYGEIGLKGRNRHIFENQLIRNIRKALRKKDIAAEIKKDDARIIIESKSSEKNISAVLCNIFGVQYFTFAEETERDVAKAMKKATSLLESIKKRGTKRVAVKTKRSDKNFHMNSMEFSKKIGEIAHRLKIKVDFSHPEEEIFAEITAKSIYFYSRKYAGPGGLPVGSSGRVLCMLSGGIDSPVAAWLMMKRGCQVGFVHFHTYRENKDVLKTKIKEITDTLSGLQLKSKLFLVPYDSYQIMTQGLVREGDDLVLFKNFMMRVAQKIAEENHYKALVTGDSLGQVASQTLENIAATDLQIKMPVIRPLIGNNKQEIIDLAQKIGTLQASNKPYKDCCSIVSRKPKTRIRMDKMEKGVQIAHIEEVVEKTMPQVEMFKIE